MENRTIFFEFRDCATGNRVLINVKYIVRLESEFGADVCGLTMDDGKSYAIRDSFERIYKALVFHTRKKPQTLGNQKG